MMMMMMMFDVIRCVLSFEFSIISRFLAVFQLSGMFGS